MKYFLLAVSALALIGMAGAQSRPACDFCWTVWDYACDGSTNCGSSTFTAPCDVEVCLRCMVICPSGYDCTHCTSTASLRPAILPTPLLTCTTTGQQACECDATNCSAHLVAGQQYTITVCLDRCFYWDCAECGHCRAVAVVLYGNPNCPTP